MEIKRNILDELYKDLSSKYVTILVGARQVGKTYLLKRVKEEAERRGLKTAYFDLEQPDHLALFNQSDNRLIPFLANAGHVVLIDEFHYLKNASHIFKAICDSERKVKIYASGSSSLEIHKHLKESLVGRKLIYHIYPCSLEEVQQVIHDDPMGYYCRYGGMPGLVHFTDDDRKKLLLQDILQSYLLKDIKSLIREENIRAFNNLLFLLAQYQGAVVPTASLGKEVGLTARTVESYLEILAQTFVNFPLHSFSGNYGNELKKSKKYYLYDLGVRNALLKNFETLLPRHDAGALVESFVFGELQKHLTPETEIRFWRLKTGEEVDFIWIKNQRPYPIEVKMTADLKTIPQGLRAFLKKYPKTKKAFVVCGNVEGAVKENEVEVAYIKWDGISKLVSTIP